MTERLVWHVKLVLRRSLSRFHTDWPVIQIIRGYSPHLARDFPRLETHSPTLTLPPSFPFPSRRSHLFKISRNGPSNIPLTNSTGIEKLSLDQIMSLNWIENLIRLFKCACEWIISRDGSGSLAERKMCREAFHG